MINPFAWVRDMFGIRKDADDRRKTNLEIERLEHERRQRESQIQRATLEDVKKYDPKAKKLEEAVKSSSPVMSSPGAGFGGGGGGGPDGCGCICAIILLLLAAILVLILVWSC